MSELDKLNNLSDDTKHKILIAVGIVGMLVIGYIILKEIAGAASSSSSGYPTYSSGSSQDSTDTSSTDNTAADYQAELTYQQGLAAIQNQQATLAEQLQASLLGAQTTATIQTGNATTANQIAVINAQTSATNSANTVQEQLDAALNAAESATNVQTAQALTNIQTAYNQTTISQILNAQNQSNANALTASQNQFNATYTDLQKLFTHENGSGLSAAGGNDTNLSLSDAISDFFNKAGTSGQNFLVSLLPGTTTQNNSSSASSSNSTSTNPLAGFLSNISGTIPSGSVS